MGDPIVSVKQGQLLGKRDKTLDGFDYFSFLGVPYAEPPVGDLRFKDPLPASPWGGIREATQPGNPAAQYDLMGLTGTRCLGGDDCLYLNVFTPKLPTDRDRPLPVMVYIHGGGLVVGSAVPTDFGPDYLVRKGVVLVTCNYRLGVMGFLCTDARNARGDMGLRDQNAALRWVRDNVAAFGGDPGNVTLFGISAGGASVEYHLLSWMSPGLFHRAIVQSGSSLNAWARTVGGVELAKKLARSLGYDEAEGKGLFEFLNGFPTEELVYAAGKMTDESELREGRMFAFTPVVNELEGYRSFVDGDPGELLRAGKFYRVPVISGICDQEGTFQTIFYKETMQAIFAGRYFDFMPAHLKSVDGLERKLAALYARRPDDANENRPAFDFLADLGFSAGVLYSAERRAERKGRDGDDDEYFYVFAYDGGLNMVKKMMGLTETKGACHGDDTGYLAPTAYVDPSGASAADLAVVDAMVTMWTDFAKTGKPTPDSKWLPLELKNFSYLNIDSKSEMQRDLYVERRKLWREIYDNMVPAKKS